MTDLPWITEEPYCQKENCSQPKERGNVVATPSSPADPFTMFVPENIISFGYSSLDHTQLLTPVQSISNQSEV